MSNDTADYISGAVTMPSIVYRGDPSDYDFQGAAIISDGAWHDLDLSSILPAGSISVYARITAYCASNFSFNFRRKGDTEHFNEIPVNPISNGGFDAESAEIIFCDSDRFIQYVMPALTFPLKTFTVLGWFL